MKSEARYIHAALTQLAAEGAPATQIADVAVSVWRKVDDALSVIVGARGVAALFRRSLYLTRGAHPWLAEVHESALLPGEFAGLHAALSKQTGDVAAAANGALLQNFTDLVGNLIGESLTERLLASLRDNPKGGPAAQDTPP